MYVKKYLLFRSYKRQVQKLHWIINCIYCIYFDIILQRRRGKRKIAAEVEQRGRSREIEGKKEEVEG